ncbi:MAG: TonB-dependent receptor [Muribaculaceae bacterium]|nr:TonB-dependent receptor [Muribaculaceae bacterium]
MKHICLPLLLTLASPLALLADGSVSGRVVNKATGQPMDYVSVQLIDSSGKPLPIGTNTAEDGTFTLPKTADGKYSVKISNIGSVDQERPVVIAGNDVNIGVIRLADDAKLLQEVVVEGVRSQMRFELDKKVFQVDANIVASGQSASELLESIPSVEVDQDGEVSLRGNSSVTVWINGKESGLTADNRAQILEQIPGETIDRIEVITNPSAKYSPEGTAGIINIILKKDRKGGYFGSAEIGANTRGGANAGFNINYNSSKWESYASIGWRMRHNTDGGSTSRRTYTDDTPSVDGKEAFLNSDGKQRNHGNNVFVRLGTTWHATEKDAISASAFGMFGHRWGSSSSLYTSNLTDHWLSDSQRRYFRSDNRGVHAELGYKHEWSDNHTLDLNVAYNHWGGPQYNEYYENYGWPEDTSGTGTLPPQEDEYREQTTSINLNSYEAKVDYANHFTSWLKLEAGFQGNYSHENTPVNTLTGTVQADATVAPELYNRFIYQNNVSALYLTLGGNVEKFSYSAGLRAEAWQVRTRSLEWGETKEDVPLYRKNFFSLFPSVFLSYSLPHDNELQINYTRRIRRPWGGMLNSFRDMQDPTDISFGNPELEPQYSNSFELNYIKSWTMHLISLSAYLRTSDNVMNRISYMADNILYTTWANVANETNTGAEIVVKNNFKVVDLTTTFNLYNNHIDAWEYSFPFEGNLYPVSGKGNDSFAWDVRCMANVRLPWSLSFQATGRYASKMLTAQGSRQGGWSVDAGLRRNFGNWSVSVNCRDIFDSRKFKNTTEGVNYTQYSERWRGGRTFQFTVKYAFGNMKSKNRQNTSAEPMDGSGYGETDF